jgi:hypothetical protein
MVKREAPARQLKAAKQNSHHVWSAILSGETPIDGNLGRITLQITEKLSAHFLRRVGKESSTSTRTPTPAIRAPLESLYSTSDMGRNKSPVNNPRAVGDANGRREAATADVGRAGPGRIIAGTARS